MTDKELLEMAAEIGKDFEMTHTVDTLMALADAYAEVSAVSTTAHAVEMQEALRTALTEVFDQLDIQAGSIEAVQAANQRLAQTAQPVREPSCDTCKHCTISSQDSFEETCFICSHYYDSKYEVKT